MNSQPTSIRIEELPDVLTVEETAAVLRVCKKVVYEDVERGTIKAARIGPKRIIRIRRETVLALLAGGPDPKK